MSFAHPSRAGPDRDRALALAGVAAVHVLIGYGLLTGLQVRLARTVEQAMTVIALAAPPPPPAPRPAKKQAREAEGRAAPPNRTARPKPATAPPAAVPLETPIAAPPVAGAGDRSIAGAARLSGPGQGGGGAGEGSGAGERGEGSGGGGIAMRSRKIAGQIVNRDYPRAVSRAGIGGSVTVTYMVGADGRVRGCTVARSSGNADLDATTCRLIEERFRYEPARNGRGEAMPEQRGWRQDWWLEGG